MIQKKQAPSDGGGDFGEFFAKKLKVTKNMHFQCNDAFID